MPMIFFQLRLPLFSAFLLLIAWVPRVASGAGVRISRAADTDGEVRDFQVSSTGKYAVYSAWKTEVPWVPHLFSVALDGSEPVSLAPDKFAEQAPYYSFRYQITPDGTRVVYSGRAEGSTVCSLYSVPISGGPPVRLSKAEENVIQFVMSPDGHWVIFSSYGNFPYRLLRAAPSGVADSSVDITPPGARPISIGEMQISPDSRHFLYMGDMLPLDGWGIYCLPVDGDGSSFIRLSRPAIPKYAMNFLVTADGRKLVYRYVEDSPTTATAHLYAVSISGPATSYLDCSGSMITGGPGVDFVGVMNFSASPDSRHVVFSAIREAVGKRELYSYPLEAPNPGPASPVKLNVPIADDQDVSDSSFIISPDSERVVYSAGDWCWEHNLFTVPIAGPLSENIPLSKPIFAATSSGYGWLNSVVFSPDGARIAFNSMQDSPDYIDLYSIPRLGPASAAIRLNPPQVKGSSGYAICQNPVYSPDGSWLFYTAQTAANRTDLLQVPSRGPAAGSINLSGVSTSYPGVLVFRLVPGQRRVVYVGQIDSAAVELYMAAMGNSLSYLPMVLR